MLSDRSVYNVGVLWPNGRMNQDATWYGSRPPSVQVTDPSSHMERDIVALPTFRPICSGTVAHLSNCSCHLSVSKLANFYIIYKFLDVWGSC